MDKNTIDPQKAINLKVRLLQAGIKQIDIAKRAGVDKSLVSNLIQGRYKSKRVEKIIEEMIGEKL
ncbi:MAG: helix-turn-helix domain-containing protein [Candidatus Eremiobacterota bacterium]